MDLVFFCTGFQESESEEEGIDEIDDDNEEEHENEHEPEVPVEKEPVIKKPPAASLPPKDTERQLSKKELKKKGLEELDAVLAELGLIESCGQDESHGNLVIYYNTWAHPWVPSVPMWMVCLRVLCMWASYVKQYMEADGFSFQYLRDVFLD